VRAGRGGWRACRDRIVDRHLIEERVDRPAQRGERGHRGFEILGLDRRLGARLGGVERFLERRFGRLGFVDIAADIRVGAVEAFLLEDVRGALVAGEEIGAVFGGDERLQRVDAGEQADEIALTTDVISPPIMTTASIRSCLMPASRC
jgi:hypothetical protein